MCRLSRPDPAERRLVPADPADPRDALELLVGGLADVLALVDSAAAAKPR